MDEEMCQGKSHDEAKDLKRIFKGENSAKVIQQQLQQQLLQQQLPQQLQQQQQPFQSHQQNRQLSPLCQFFILNHQRE